MAEARSVEKGHRANQPDDGRRRLIIAVRAACKRQGIDDDTRKAMQQQLIGKASMSDMSLPELGRLLDHLNKGWKGPMGHRAHIGKIKALWWTLYWLGEVDAASDQAISTFVTRQTDISAVQFLDHRKAASVIEALKSWAHRAGVNWPTKEQTEAVVRLHPEFNEVLHERHCVVDALTINLANGGGLQSPTNTYLRSSLGLAINHWTWTALELDTAIRLLGRKHRRMLGKS